jgi:hypothetical protein
MFVVLNIAKKVPPPDADEYNGNPAVLLRVLLDQRVRDRLFRIEVL